MKTITVDIKDGEVQITTSGFAGKSCQAETADLERALGMTTSDRATTEMYKPVVATAQAKAGR
jgi:hypothetical protein